MATISRKGFAQVEPNHLSGIVTGQILAQLPVDTAAMGTIIENGRFAKYDYATGKVNLTGPGEWMLIYNEQKFYDERKQSLKDFAMKAENYTDKEIVPRMISTVLGDVYTTNAFGGAAASDTAEVAGPDLAEGNIVSVGTNGWLEKAENEGVPTFQVAKVYTMPDGQPGVKLIRIK
jgi:hypothetical protein